MSGFSADSPYSPGADDDDDECADGDTEPAGGWGGAEGGGEAGGLGAAEEEAASAATFEAMLLPWAAEEDPRLVALPQRIDYLNVISEALGGGGALGVHARCEGQADLGVASRPTASVHTSEPCHCCEQVTRQPILPFLDTS